jgi:hypothetical protein
MTDIVDLVERRAAQNDRANRAAADTACAVPPALQDELVALIAPASAAGALDLDAKAQRASAVAEALSDDPELGGDWRRADQGVPAARYQGLAALSA